ncbi:MAG: glycosyltransferase family 4 protein [Acetobacteraceae bacterium]
MNGLHRLWQVLPHRMRREALFGGMELIAPRLSPAAAAGASGPFIVAGFFGAASGLGSAVRRLTAVMEQAGLAPSRADLTGPMRQGERGPPPSVPPGPGTLLVHVNGPMLPWALHVLGRPAVAGKRVIAVWNWELPVLPRDWQRGFRFAHRIWVSSHFTAAAVATSGDLPVDVIPYAIPDPDPAPMDRAAFGLPADAFVSLSVFDAASSVARKNPLAAIRAHRLAFGNRPDRILLLKTHGTQHAGAAWHEVAAAAAAQPNVRILDQHLDRRSLWALLRAADAFVSLHRSEGFGMGIAEAMRAGRPVVATGWSGNMDFMPGEGALPIPYDLVPARDPQDTYDLPEARWAEPHVEAAAAALRSLADDPVRRAAMGEAASTQIVRLLSLNIVQNIVRNSLAVSGKTLETAGCQGRVFAF